MFKYNSKEFTCLKVSLYPEQCYVLNEVSLIIKPKEYNLIPLNDYYYGSYENPRVIFNTSILPEQIEVLDDIMDEPILYESSKELYYRLKVDRLIDELDPSDVYFALCDYFDYKGDNKIADLEK